MDDKEREDLIGVIKSYIELEKASGMEEYFFRRSLGRETVMETGRGSLDSFKKEVLNLLKFHLALLFQRKHLPELRL